MMKAKFNPRGIVFDENTEWTLENETAKPVAIYGVLKNDSKHLENTYQNLLILV